MHYLDKFGEIWISPWIRYLQYQKVDKKTFLPIATLTPNHKRFLFGGRFFRWTRDTSTGYNLQIIGKVRKFLKKSTCKRKLENLKHQQKVQSDQLFTWKATTWVTWYKNWYILTNSCSIAFQTFIISYLTYQSKTFKTLIKKNYKSSRFKNFRRFREFAVHYEAAELVESWENFVTLADKRLDHILGELKLISNLQNQQKTGQVSFSLDRWQQTSCDTRIDKYWLILVALPLRHLLLVIWRIKAVPLRL